MVNNIHRRIFKSSGPDIGKILTTLSSKEDKLWPKDKWPPIKFDKPLGKGAKGGHGPIRYCIEEYKPGISIIFRFTGPKGFDGTHGFYIMNVDADHVKFEHRVNMKTKGIASISWPLIYEPLHDALMEDAMENVEVFVKQKDDYTKKYSIWVKFLRWALKKRGKKKK